MNGLPAVLSVNVGRSIPTGQSTVGFTGIDKYPVAGPVEVSSPERRDGSGLAGDVICDGSWHGGPDQAVYAYAREDLDDWQSEIGRPLRSGMFGENLTTAGVDVTEALVGERWRIGGGCVLEVSAPRTPCRTFAWWLAEKGWVRRFVDRGSPGAYLRVITPGTVMAGEPITVESRPDHAVTISVVFRAINGRPDLLPLVQTAGETLSDGVRRRIHRRLTSQS
ncbi:MAG: MOSC domain-containing protein [Actinophytocola sp.]|uniref:MOSC domain-containing protein n=1 Tax=Actinophytocola sp. TaxID=1872138 RepID=UPI003C72447C